MSKYPRRVSIYEVGLRDGLQNESFVVSTEGKVRIAQALVAAGIQRMEATSFVSPTWIPQLADAEALLKTLPRASGVLYSALCPNAKGLERALASQVDEIAVFVSASESHNKKNVNRSIGESLSGFREIALPALRAGLRVRGYVSTVWGCPYEGAVAIEKSIEVTQTLLDLGCYEVSLGDTIGIGNPAQTERILDAMMSRFRADKLAMHMHDTRALALPNILIGLEKGITTFDAAIGGMGGCPYAPGAAGNVATEDLVGMLSGMGIETAIDADALFHAGHVAATEVHRALPSKVHQAGIFKIRAAT